MTLPADLPGGRPPFRVVPGGGSTGSGNGHGGDPKDVAVILDPKDPYPGALTFLAREWSMDGAATLYEQAGVFYAYTGTHFAELEEPAVRAKLWEFAAAAKRWSPAGQNVAFQPNTTRVSNLLDATRALAHLPTRLKAPLWLGAEPEAPAEEIVALSNGLLHVPSGRLFPPTARFYTQNALTFPYAANAPRPALWLDFLGQLWEEDAECIETLQEMFGHLLLPDTRQQKAFLLVGPKRSGKGTIARVLRALVGEANTCAPTLAGLSMNFGLQPLIGKPLAIISDARLSGKADQATIAERILAISGEDAVTIDRKHLPPWTGQLPTRFLILTNELPRIADSSGALAGRFVVMTLTRTFYGREDPMLTAKLLEELPGIFAWALEGWDRLQQRGYFVQPASSKDSIQEMEDLGSPISAFIRDRCRVESGRQVETTVLYDGWRKWCRDEGWEKPGTAQTFGRDLRAVMPGLKVTQPRVSGRQVRFYEGIDLTYFPDTDTRLTRDRENL